MDPSTKTRTRPFYPLSEHTKARIDCIQACANHDRHGYPDGLTTSEMARVTGQTTNNCAKRAQESAQEGYLEVYKVGGQRQMRKSLNSPRRLEIWIRTGKPLPFPTIQ